MDGSHASHVVVVFPTIFSSKRIPQLISNIKKILAVNDQRFESVRRDGDVILVDANDPVFASSSIGMLFGIERIAIARRTESDFDGVVSEITRVGGNLLLKGERFLVRVEGATGGFLAKDVEMAATSSIIEKKAGQLGAAPGTEERHDKLLYTYLTKGNAYVCIFTDTGGGGIPFRQRQRPRQAAGGMTICAVYDEMSAVSCLEAVKQGYDTKIIVCYRARSELIGLARMISRIIPGLARRDVELEFFHVKMRSAGVRNYLAFVSAVSEIMLRHPDGADTDSVALALSPLVFSKDFIKGASRRVFEGGKIPVMPLAGVDAGLFADARQLGLGERGTKRLQRTVAGMAAGGAAGAAGMDTGAAARDALRTRERITVRTGPNNVHDILDSLEAP